MNVLDHGEINLEECMGGDAAVIEAARFCYQSVAKSPEADVRLLDHLIDEKHNTPFEHAVLRWKVRCPIFVARQWLRHRMGSFVEKSLRYCVASPGYYMPDELDESQRVAYRIQMEATWSAYQRLMKLGVRREQARAVLGTAFYTEFLWTVNAWSFMNWLTKRLDPHAQMEHRRFAEAGLVLWRGVMPQVSAAYEAARA